MDVDIYIHGRCHLFALAAAEVFGYKICSLWDEEPFDEDCDVEIVEIPPALVHMWVETPSGQKIDCTGPFDDNYLEDEFEEPNEPYLSSDTIKSIKKMIKNKMLSKPKKGEIKRLKSYIANRKDWVS